MKAASPKCFRYTDKHHLPPAENMRQFAAVLFFMNVTVYSLHSCVFKLSNEELIIKPNTWLINDYMWIYNSLCDAFKHI